MAAQKYDFLENTPFMFVETEEQLQQMKKKLVKEKEIAVDLEHHNYRSYQGFTCLMQISTRKEDFIVDTLKLKTQLQTLNEVFDNPYITKVLHGSDFDVEWLQKDFGIYIVNMFDTGQAARVLQLKQFGLAYLLQNYCGVIASKKYQLADWRERPLPEEMVKYAREDTHYLLYIYDVLRQELIDKGIQSNPHNHFALLRAVLQKSNQLCMKQYEKSVLKDHKYSFMIGNNRSLQNLR